MAAEVGCPYVGLVPFTETDAQFFFGRDQETQQVVANLFASRLTLLYGASGVGKSSVLRAGVLHEFERRAARATACGETPEQAVVYLKDWQGDTVSRFREALRRAIAKAFPEAGEVLPAATANLDDILATVTDRLKIDLLVILDQFEEYFLYHGEERVSEELFARQLTAAVNRPGLPVSFLLVLRDDALARLDRFKARIPRLFSNYLRLRPLASEAARAAITEPVAVFNELPTTARGCDGQVRLDPELVTAVLEQVRRGHVQVGEGGRADEAGETGVEAAFLQLVMTRVWEEEVNVGSRVLRAETFSNLGGAEAIVRGHLDRVMGELSVEECQVCARVFQHLVTPSGVKIAHTAADLAEFAEIELVEMERLLTRLSGSRMRLVTPVAPTDATGDVRYESYHDALAQAMLEWRRRYVEERERKVLERKVEGKHQELEAERRTAHQLRRLSRGLAISVALALAAMIFAFFQQLRAKESAQQAEESAQVAQEQERKARSAGQQVTRLATELQVTQAKEKQQRLEARARAAELTGEVEKAAQLRHDAATSREESENLARILLKLGAKLGASREFGEAEIGAFAELKLAELHSENDRERRRAEEAEQRLKETNSELVAAGAKLMAAGAELMAAQATIANMQHDFDVWKPKPLEVAWLGMRFVPIPSGRFLMGSPENELQRADNETLHEVEITRPYWMAETEVTQAQWRSLMKDNPSSFTQCGGDCPVENINWFDAVSFANRLSQRENLPSCYEFDGCENSLGECRSPIFKGLECQGYRLPTEAEWEYAARAGTTTPFWTGENVTTDQANYDGNYPYADYPKGDYLKNTVVVRSFDPNPWGLYEVHGNVWEWVHDWYGPYSGELKRDPIGPGWGSARVIRGGSWVDGVRGCRTAYRYNFLPVSRSYDRGFRLVRTIP